MLVVMRHSVRLDAAEGADWVDRAARPYDTPIADFDLAHVEADRLAALKLTTVVSSPFRRCLQTAGVAARALALPEVHVDDRLGELMHMVRKACLCLDEADDHAAAAAAAAATEGLTLLDGAEVERALGDGVRLATRRRRRVAWDESAEDGQSRFLEALAEWSVGRDSLHTPPRLLVVTHGDLVGAAASALLGDDLMVFDVAECGYVAFDLAGPKPTLAEARRVQYLQGPPPAP